MVPPCYNKKPSSSILYRLQKASRKMQHTNQAEMNMLYDSFCRLWANGNNASLSTTCSGGKVTAKLEVELGKPSEPGPGAPRQRTATPLSTQGTQASGAPRRKTTHRGPAAKAKSLARAVARAVALFRSLDSKTRLRRLLWVPQVLPQHYPRPQVQLQVQECPAWNPAEVPASLSHSRKKWFCVRDPDFWEYFSEFSKVFFRIFSIFPNFFPQIWVRTFFF